MVSEFRWNRDEIVLTLLSENENLDLTAKFAPKWRIGDAQFSNARNSPITSINLKLVPADRMTGRKNKAYKKCANGGPSSENLRHGGKTPRAVREKLARSRAEFENVRKSYDELQAQKKRYRAIVDAACRESGEDKVKTKLHNSVSSAAAKLEFKLSRIGSVGIGRLNNELYYADIDIAAEGKLDEIATLIAALEEIDLKPVWRQLELRPDNRPRPQASTGVDSINLANQLPNVERTRVTMRGTLRVICADETVNSATQRAARK